MRPALFASSLVALFAFVSAQTDDGGDTNSTSGAATTHEVQVGAGGNLVFDPPIVNASVGDTVRFTFLPKNHTVTQSSFSSPCEPLNKTNNFAQQGFDTGYVPVAPDNTGTPPVVSLQINNTDPIWLYCAQKGHCVAGMVMAINVPQDRFDAFLNTAKGSNGTSSSPSGSAGSPSGSTAPSGSATSAGGGGASQTSAPSSARDLKAVSGYGAAVVLGVGSLMFAIL